jgi:hypothetical protein
MLQAGRNILPLEKPQLQPRTSGAASPQSDGRQMRNPEATKRPLTRVSTQCTSNMANHDPARLQSQMEATIWPAITPQSTGGPDRDALPEVTML